MKIEKVKVKAMSRTLNDRYTKEESQKISFNFSAEYVKILQEEIDREIILTVKAEGLVKQGWITIPFTVKISLDWFKENMQDEYAMILGKMYFKSHEDAVLYSLTWSGHETEYS
jgi:hypothetical protein